MPTLPIWHFGTHSPVENRCLKKKVMHIMALRGHDMHTLTCILGRKPKGTGVVLLLLLIIIINNNNNDTVDDHRKRLFYL